jgi:hypothetical protein
VNRPKLHVWAERPEPASCWVWRYGFDDATGAHVPAGSAMAWHEALVAAEMLLYAQHHAVPRLAGV